MQSVLLHSHVYYFNCIMGLKNKGNIEEVSNKRLKTVKKKKKSAALEYLGYIPLLRMISPVLEQVLTTFSLCQNTKCYAFKRTQVKLEQVLRSQK